MMIFKRNKHCEAKAKCNTSASITVCCVNLLVVLSRYCNQSITAQYQYLLRGKLSDYRRIYHDIVSTVIHYRDCINRCVRKNLPFSSDSNWSYAPIHVYNTIRRVVLGFVSRHKPSSAIYSCDCKRVYIAHSLVRGSKC